MCHQLLPIVFSPATAAAYNVSRFRVELGVEFSQLYHSAVVEASDATAGPPAPQPQPQPLLLLLLLLLVTTVYAGMFLETKSAARGHEHA